MARCVESPTPPGMWQVRWWSTDCWPARPSHAPTEAGGWADNAPAGTRAMKGCRSAAAPVLRRECGQGRARGRQLQTTQLPTTNGRPINLPTVDQPRHSHRGAGPLPGGDEVVADPQHVAELQRLQRVVELLPEQPPLRGGPPHDRRVHRNWGRHIPHRTRSLAKRCQRLAGRFVRSRENSHRSFDHHARQLQNSACPGSTRVC